MTSSSSTKILVTGSNGFIGKNLIFQAKERLNFEIDTFTRKNSDKTLKEKLLKADFLIHLAGENRPETDDQFQIVNVGLTKKISEILLQYSHQIPIVFTSSSQAEI
ncbi:capsular polysaccharide biosynthesis protein CapF, partial [Gammaproteobacteria bacterium]|nr:capsular polysaccharide biosynthesis protein CapF [Gammaproteobacteria bacterium]